MKVRVFTLAFDPASRSFDDGALRAFMEGERHVIEVRDHFFESEGQPVWALLVTYREHSDVAPMRSSSPRSARVDPREELDPAEHARYEAMRAWRNERMKRDGKPPYAALNNKQIAEVAQRDPATLSALGEVNGVGEAKLRDYGEEILAVLAALRAGDPATEPQPSQVKDGEGDHG